MPTQPKPLPAPNSDFYELAETLNAEELALLKQVRAFMEGKVAPIINKYWTEDAFPFELLPAFKELNIGGLGMQGYGCRGGSALLFGLAAMEMSRVDSSIATFFGVHNGLAWAPSTQPDRKSRSRSGCRRWPAGKRSAASASPSRWSAPARPAA